MTNAKLHRKELNLVVNCRVDSRRKMVRSGKTGWEMMAINRPGDTSQGLRSNCRNGEGRNEG